MSWKTISVLLLFAAAFLNGLILGQGWEGPGYIYSVAIWVVCSISIVAILGGSRILKSIKENAGTRKVIIAILIGLVSIPLVFIGTCLLAIGGSFIEGLFTR